jgi:branched-chain amino acid transport system permease protein
MGLFIQLLFNTLEIGSVYVLFSLGLTLIFGTMKIINFAHGQFFAAMALLISSALPTLTNAFGWPVWAAYVASFVGSIVFIAVLSMALYWGGFYKFTRDLLGSFTLSLGFLFMGQGILLALFGGAPRVTPRLVSGDITVLGGVVNAQRLLIFGVAIGVTLALNAFVQRSRLGNALRAISDDYEAAMLQGIRYRRISCYGFALGSILAAVAGGLIAPLVSTTPTISDDYLVKAFIIIIVGGLGSIPGAILASFLIAAIESFGGYYFDLTSAAIVSNILVIIFLLLRPRGFMGQAVKIV